MQEVKSSHILRQAKRFLWSGVGSMLATQHEYICWAVEDAGSYLLGSKTDPRVAYIKRSIMDRIGFCTVEDWLEHHVPGFVEWRESVDNDQVNLQVQTYRHRWLDSLIAEFEAAGD